MTFLQVVLTIFIAALVGALFFYVFRVSGPWGSLWTFLLVLVLAGLAAAVWIAPVGPVIHDVAWVPILFVILLFALILAAASPSARRTLDASSTPGSGTDRSGDNKAAVTTLSVFFWFLLIFLFVAIMVGVFV